MALTSGMSQVVLEIEGKELRVLHCSYSFHRDIDSHTGKPSSKIMGGTIRLEIDSSVDSVKLFAEWAIRGTATKDGKVRIYFPTTGSESSMTVEFYQAYLVEWSQSANFHAEGKYAISESLVLSAKKISVQGQEHENPWVS